MALAFVIHEHSGFGPTQYDLMLEDGPALATWQIPVSPPEIGQGQSISATKLPDHRRHYLDYQGPVSGNRGEVGRLDRGTYELLARAEGLWRVKLRGGAIEADFELVRQEGNVWQLHRL
jgi:hypothetical protein